MLAQENSPAVDEAIRSHVSKAERKHLLKKALRQMHLRATSLVFDLDIADAIENLNNGIEPDDAVEHMGLSVEWIIKQEQERS